MTDAHENAAEDQGPTSDANLATDVAPDAAPATASPAAAAAQDSAAPQAAAPQADVVQTSDPQPTGEADGFVAAVPMEADPDAYYVGDRGRLSPELRRVLVRLLNRRFLIAERHREDWEVLIKNQGILESRLHDLFIELVVDQQRGVAYKRQVRSDELDVPVLLRDDAYTRAETLVLVYLRTVYQRESTTGEAAPRVDVEEVEQTVMSYFAEADGDRARRQKDIRAALRRLGVEGLVEEQSPGRFTISPMVEIVLSAERLAELAAWLRENTATPDDDAAPRAAGSRDAELALDTDLDEDPSGDPYVDSDEDEEDAAPKKDEDSL